MVCPVRLLLASLGLAVLALFVMAPFEQTEAVVMPCHYCRFCSYCPKCDTCPCSETSKDPTCKYCKYCMYCPACKLCETMCVEGGLGHLLGDAIQWVSNKASDLLGVIDPDSVDFVEVDSDISELNQHLLDREQMLIHEGSLQYDPDDHDLSPEEVRRLLAEAAQRIKDEKEKKTTR